MVLSRIHILALVSALLLAGCVTTTEEEPVTAVTAAPAGPDPVVQQPVEEAEPTPETEPAPEQAPLLTSTDLLGLEPAEIQELLGPVSLRRWENDAQVVQYQNGHCVLDIYFYESAPGEAFEATYISARTSSGTKVMNDICLSSLMGGVWVEDNTENPGGGDGN